MADFLWWREGVIYQIYLRSFSDSNGDGIGDLEGIISHLDYLADLGIDAIWLSPIHPSPDKDFGYDVSDYLSVDLRYGSLEIFDQLVSQAHARSIHVILDMVVNHTSNQHAWFRESSSSLVNSKRDWYIWRDQPNNWQSAFGGSAWTFDPPSGQYYLHLFAPEQPDLNWRNPQVRQTILDTFKFWLDRGVDGFRLDVFNAYFKHPSLPDDPPKFGLRGFDSQRHIFEMDQPEMLSLLADLRHLLDSYPERYAVGETYLASAEKAARYCGPNGLHAAFSFDFTSLNSNIAEALGLFPWNPEWILKRILEREAVAAANGIWPTTVLSNHDLPRAASRYTRGENDALARISMALLLTLRGTPFIYYGEEIGLRNIHLRRSEILDPPGKRYWPVYTGRDGCRAPMQWDSTRFAGFSPTPPWLPLNPDFSIRNVAAQAADPSSLLNFTRTLLSLRKELPALQKGNFVPLASDRGCLVFLRTHASGDALVALNFTGRSVKLALPERNWAIILSSAGTATYPSTSLAGYEVRILTAVAEG